MTSYGIEAPTLKFLAPYLAKIFTPDKNQNMYAAISNVLKKVNSSRQSSADYTLKGSKERHLLVLQRKLNLFSIAESAAKQLSETRLNYNCSSLGLDNAKPVLLNHQT